MFEIEIDVDNFLLKEDLNNSFREIFNIKNFSIEVKKERPVIDHLFEEEFYEKKEMSFDVILDSKSYIQDCDFRSFFKIKNFDIFCEGVVDKGIDETFEKFFDFQKIEPSPFKISLNEDGTIHDEDFRQHFETPNFEITLDTRKKVDDIIFENYFNTQKEQKYDYDIIENLKKSLNSRKILTREEREQIPELEPEISTIDQEKKETVSIEEGLEKSKSVIKENAFYKIVEFDASELVTQVPTEIDTSYKEEVDQKIIDLENKYEDLLQKTVNDYQNKMNKMLEDFSTFRNNVTQQVNRMSFVSSATGGGAVNILDMDDVDKSNLNNGYTLSYNNSLKKFEFINPANVGSSASFDSMQADVFTITQPDLDNGYIDLSSPADSNYYELSEFHINGVVNIYQTNYDFLSSTRINISSLILDVGDIIRIVYIKS